MSVAFSDNPQETNLAPYRAVSKAAVLSLILAILGASGLLFMTLLVLCVAGIVFGLIAMANIRRYPDELIGKTVAIIGTVSAAAFLAAGIGIHVYTYITECPEGYDRIAFYQLKKDQVALSLNGKEVFVKGYVHPGVQGMGPTRKFVLVPDMKICCFGGQPDPKDMIEVTLTGSQRVQYSTFLRRVAGKFQINPTRRKAIGDLDAGAFVLDEAFLR